MANLKVLTENSTLAQLSDVDATAPNAGDVLTWGGASWAPDAPVAGGGGAAVYRFAISDPPAGDSLYKFQVAPVAGQIVKVSTVMAGTGSVDVNVELEAAEILGADLAATTSWTDSGALAEAVVAGDEIDISVKNVVSPVGYLVVQIDFEAS